MGPLCLFKGLNELSKYTEDINTKDCGLLFPVWLISVKFLPSCPDANICHHGYQKTDS